MATKDTAEAATVKAVVVKGCVKFNGLYYNEGQTVSLTAGEAARLSDLGIVEVQVAAAASDGGEAK